MEAAIGSRKRTRRTSPSPPCHCLAPPEGAANLVADQTHRKTQSQRFGVGQHELDIWVCATLVPLKRGPAPDPLFMVG